MKQIASAYTYNKTSGVIVLTGVNIDRDQLLLVVNTTRNVTYYNFADSATTLQAFTQGENTSVTLASAVVSASSAHTNADALTIYYDDQISSGVIAGTVTANAILSNVEEGYDEGINQNVIAVHVKDLLGNVLGSSGSPLPISGTVTANLDAASPVIADQVRSGMLAYASDSGDDPLFITGIISNFPATQTIAGTVTAMAGGETPTSGTATLTTDTRSEINTEGFGHIALEIVSSGATWLTNGLVAQAYNGTAPSNPDIFAPAGIRYRHSNDTSVNPTTALNNIYFNLGIGPTVGNGFGTNLVRVDGSNDASLVLPTTGTRYFLFDLTTSRFALRPFFSAGTVMAKYRLYKGKHPFFSARNVIVRGENTDGKINVTVPDGISANVVYAVQDGDGTTFGVDRDFPITGTVTVGNSVTIGSLPAIIINPNDDGQGGNNGPVVEADSGAGSDPRYMVVAGGFDSSSNEFRALTFGVGSALLVGGTVTVGNTVTIGSLPAISGTVTANTFALQGTAVTNSNFTSTIPAPLVSYGAARRVLTVFNEGAGLLYISAGGVCTTTSYQVRVGVGEYWECPEGQLSLQHTSVFDTAGVAKVSQVIGE